MKPYVLLFCLQFSYYLCRPMRDHFFTLLTEVEVAWVYWLTLVVAAALSVIDSVRPQPTWMWFCFVAISVGVAFANEWILSFVVAVSATNVLLVSLAWRTALCNNSETVSYSVARIAASATAGSIAAPAFATTLLVAYPG